MSRFITALFSAAILCTLSSCGAASTMPLKPEATTPSTSGTAALPSTPVSEEKPQPLPTPESDEADGVVFVTLDIGGRTFSATLADNDAAKALAERLPLTLELSELHGNEKYIYLDEDLPTDSLQPGQIQAGDLMLYGSNCLVLFYESFESSYSYTRLGSVDDPEGLTQAVGGGGVTITFAQQ